MQTAVNKRRVYQDLWNTGLPIFAELFLVSLFQMVDTALLKPCGTVAIAAVGLTAEPVNLLEFAFFALQTAIIARTAGLYVKRDWPAVHRLLAAAVKLISGAALVLGVAFAVFAEPILRLFGADAQTLPIAAAYLRVTLVAFLFRRIYSGIASVLKGIGAPRWSFVLNLIANAVNIVFDYLLINGVGPFPALGAVGAASATAIGCAVGLVLSVFVCARCFRTQKAPVPAAVWRASAWGTIRSICGEAAPMVGEKVMIRLGTFLAIQRIALLGATSFAAYRILITLQYFPFLSSEAISTTVLIFASQAYATRDGERAKAYTRGGLLCAAAIAAAFGALFFALSGPLMTIYSDDPEVIRAGAQVLRFIAFYQPFQAVALVYAGTMRACGLAKIPTAVTTVGIVLIRPALVYLLTPSLGVLGAWLAISADEIFRMFVLLTRRGRLWHTYAQARVPQPGAV